MISSSLDFPVRNRSGLRLIRDLAMVALCLAIVASFVADIWEAPPPAGLRRDASVSDASRGA